MDGSTSWWTARCGRAPRARGTRRSAPTSSPCCRNFVRRGRLGKVFGSNLCYVLPGGNKRAPDVSFVAAGRFPADEAPTGFAELTPDLAVEVLSPDDRPRDVLDKVGEYVQAGVRLVWVIDPRKRQANLYRSLTDVQVIDAGGTLDGDHVLPGFHCPMAEVLG